MVKSYKVSLIALGIMAVMVIAIISVTEGFNVHTEPNPGNAFKVISFKNNTFKDNLYQHNVRRIRNMQYQEGKT